MVVQDRVYTVEEFETWIAQPEHADGRFELIQGEIVEKAPTEQHSLIVGNIYMALRMFVEPRGLGCAAFEVRRRVAGDDYNARLPDAEFTRKERLLPVVTKGPVPQMPDLAVEVKSPADSFIRLREKAIYYLKNSTQLVWLVFPDQQQIEIHTNEGAVQTLDLQDTLDGGNILSSFQMPVADVFRIS